MAESVQRVVFTSQSLLRSSKKSNSALPAKKPEMRGSQCGVGRKGSKTRVDKSHKLLKGQHKLQEEHGKPRPEKMLYIVTIVAPTPSKAGLTSEAMNEKARPKPT